MKHLGLASIILTWIGILTVIRIWKGNVSKTISQHAAQSRSGQVFYFLLFTLTLSLFCIFVYGWLVPAFGLPIWFRICIGMGVFCQMLAVAIPETRGWRVPVHRYSAFMMSLLLIPAGAVFISSAFAGTIRMSALCAVFIQFLIAAILIPRQGYHRHILWLQMAYVALFHIVIIVASYAGAK